jgi:outer membrane protein
MCATRSALLVLLAATAYAQERGPEPLTIEQAVEFALVHHPGLQTEISVEEAKRAQVAVGRAAYLPSVDLSLQINVGTGNVLRGSLYSLPGIPSVSGPPTKRSFRDAAFGALAGIGTRWDVLGLVERMAEVDTALAEAAQAHAAVEARRLAIAFAAADQFFDVISNAETVRAARAILERARVFDESVEVLTKQELRPGTDASRARSELALAMNQLIRAERAEALSRAELARSLGVPGRQVKILPGPLLALPVTRTTSPSSKHPLIIEAEAGERAAQAKKRAVELAYLPRLDLLASLWVRGSGLTSDKLPPSPGNGIVPDTPNWLTGVVLSWPAVELVTARARARVEAANLRAANARKREVLQAVQTQLDEAHQILDAAWKEAANTPIELKAAHAAEAEATARYRAGLAEAIEVADAQRLLAQAELDDAVARLNVRRAELLLARALGDLGPFLDGVRGER